MLIPFDIIAAALAVIAAAGFAAYFGAAAAGVRDDRIRDRDRLQATNIFIADMAALMGKLMNVRKDYVAPAAQSAQVIKGALQQAGETGGSLVEAIESADLDLALWPEWYFSAGSASEKLITVCGEELDLVQLIRMLDYNLTELAHFIQQRNILATNLAAHQRQQKTPAVQPLALYLHVTEMIDKNTEENLFFIDRAIEKSQTAARQNLPLKLAQRVADLDLKKDVAEAVPPKDFIKGWVG